MNFLNHSCFWCLSKMLKVLYGITACLALVVNRVESGLPNQCENYLLLRDVVPIERVRHPIETNSKLLYMKLVQDALAQTGSNAKVEDINNFETEGVRGYHYYVKFNGSIYDTGSGPCNVEWIQIPFVPGMPKLMKGVDCSFDVPGHYDTRIVPASTPPPDPDFEIYDDDL